MDKMAEEQVADQLQEMLGGIYEIASIRTFEDSGLLTQNQGLVIRYDDGTEFQLTIVKSK